MDDFLNQVIAGDLAHVAAAAAIVGIVVFAIIQWVDNIVSKGQTQPGLSPDIKFYGSIILSFIIPVGAYVIQTLQHQQHIVLTGLFLACAVGYVASQGIHWALGGGSKKANAVQEAEIHPTVPQPIEDPAGTLTIDK